MKHNIFILSFLAIATLLTACKKEEIVVTEGEALAMKVNEQSIKLDQELANKDALIFSWTSGTNGKSGNSISYYFEFDRVGNDFKGGYKLNIGKTTDRNKSFTHSSLNSLLMELWPELKEHYGELISYEARITATVAQDAAPVQVSPLVFFQVAVYENVYKYMFIGGDATVAGTWSLSDAERMSSIDGEEGGFYYEGMLNVGELKFVVSRENFDYCFVKESEDDDTKMAYRYKIGEDESGEGIFNVPDYKWKITQCGLYKVRMNYKQLTCSIELVESQEYIYLKGTAIGSTLRVPITRTLHKYRYSGLLMQGSYRFVTSISADYPAYVRGASDNILVRCESGCGEESYWNVPNTAFYVLDIDMNTLTMNISVSDIDNVWMIGDATAGGWSWDKVTQMTKVSDGVFSFTGELASGQIKFPLEIRTDWAGFFIVAPANGTPAKGKTAINIVSNIPADESLDRKWIVGSQGTYTITINLSEMTVEFEQ